MPIWNAHDNFLVPLYHANPCQNRSDIVLGRCCLAHHSNHSMSVSRFNWNPGLLLILPLHCQRIQFNSMLIVTSKTSRHSTVSYYKSSLASSEQAHITIRCNSKRVWMKSLIQERWMLISLSLPWETITFGMENAPWLHVLMIHKVASLVTTLHLWHDSYISLHSLQPFFTPQANNQT